LVARRLSILSESPIKWVDSFRLEEAFTGYGAGNADLTRLRTSRLILLDDLGKEKLTDKVASGIFKIIDHRTSHGLTTIITSNFTPTALADRFADETLGGAIRGRLIDFFDRYLLEKVNP
jgi:DNA replication protein DnaC